MDPKLADLEKENQRLKKELDKEVAYSRDQRQFIHRMSHDIRTPLNAIMGYAKLIKEIPSDTSKVKDYADNILKSGSYMLDIIGEILDMSRIESGFAGCKKAEFNLEDCLDDIRTIIDPLINEKDQIFTISIDNIDHRNVICDENYLKQILINLLSNACKYTDKGGLIELTVKGSDNKIIFVVKDNGRGMSKEFQERIFTPFEREHQDNASDPGGTGLGLVLIKNLVTIMGGSLSFESKLGRGSVFTVIIPVEQEISDAHDNNIVSSSKKITERPDGMYCTDSKDNSKNFDSQPYRGILKGLNILVAEDNELNAGILSEILSHQGAVIHIDSNGRKLIDTYLNSPAYNYDLILMDVQMPELDGYEATRLIRQSSHEDAAKIPIIAMTANAFDKDIQKALDAGMNAHVTKPIDINDIEKAFYKLRSTR